MVRTISFTLVEFYVSQHLILYSQSIPSEEMSSHFISMFGQLTQIRTKIGKVDFHNYILEVV
jgi:hypothetical protein